MITVTQLSRGYPSTWKKIFPFLSRLVKKCNLQKEIFNDPIPSESDPKRRALINETGFQLYKQMLINKVNKAKLIPQKKILKICNEVHSYIKNLDINYKDLSILNDEEVLESSIIAENLYHYFLHNEKNKKIILSPRFSGCGMISECFGDILAGTTLYEIKSGERDFRIADLKQLLIYLTLDYSSHQNKISHIGLFNPRLGSYIVLPIKDSIELASGQSTTDCFNELINFLNSPEDFK